MKKFFLPLTLITILNGVFCQEEIPRLINQKSAGALIEYGQPYYYLPEGIYRYYVAMFGGLFGFPLYKTTQDFNLSLDLYPHYAQVWVRNDQNYFEVGLNVRLGLNISVSPNDVFSGKLGCGPHYINVVTEKQANGFIFSDYFLIAYKRRLMLFDRTYSIDLEFGYRHISNAGIQEPNRSISNFVFGFGFYRSF